MWGFGSSEPEEAPQPPPQQPAVQPPAGGSTLDAVLANWDAMNFGSGSSSTNQPQQPQQQTLEDMINNNAAGGGGYKPSMQKPPPTNLPAGGVGGSITTLPANSGGSLGLWGYGPDVPMDEVHYPGDKDDGWNGHGEGHIKGDGWGGNTGGAPGPLPKPVMPKKLNKKQMKRWCRKNDVPMKDCEEGYGHVKYEEDKKTDIHYILDNFHEGENHPWTHPGDGGMMGGGDKMDKQEELDNILDKFYGEKYLPHHEPKHQQDYIDSIAAKLKMAKEAKMKHPGMKPGMPTTLPETGQIPYPGLPADSWGPECIDRALEADEAGAKGRECMGRDEAICRDHWSFGIAPSTVGNSTDYYVQAWHEKEGTDWPLFRDFEGAIELCIGSSKKHDDTSYMTVTTEEATYYLVCPGVGKSDKNPKLKITDDDTIDIVNFQRGSGDEDVMWQITGEGMDMTNPWCLWEEVPHDAAKPMMPPMPQWMPPAP